MTEHSAEIEAAVMEVLEGHAFVIDGPPAAIGVRCPCGMRQAANSPQAAVWWAYRHIAQQVARRLTPPASRDDRTARPAHCCPDPTRCSVCSTPPAKPTQDTP